MKHRRSLARGAYGRVCAGLIACLLVTAPARALGAGSAGRSTAQSAQPAAAPTQGSGQVLFSRSENSPDQAQSAAPRAPAALAGSVTDAMRIAPQFVSYDFTVHLDPATTSLEVLLRTTVRNNSVAPLSTLPLQLRSSLHFDSIRADDTPLPFAVHTVESDADSTGSLTEAAVQLPKPLAPGGRIALVIGYGGTIPASSGRLDRIGTPALPAAQTDWDRIGEDFTGLRGFGDSVWYPVSSVPALLGDGAKLFREIGRQRALNAAADVRMHITATLAHAAPNLAVLDGEQITVPAPDPAPTAEFPGVVHLDLPDTKLGYRTPSIVVATRTEAARNVQIVVGALPQHASQAGDYTAATDLLQPIYKDWFGTPPAQPLLLVDLPVDGGARSEDGDALLLSLAGDAKPEEIAGELSAPLAHAYFRSPQLWLEEGVAGLMSLLWTEHSSGRDAAVAELGGEYSSLALAEPSSPGTDPGQPLLHAQEPIFYREKATAVLWDLRMMIGDAALANALQTYDPDKDTDPSYFPSVVRQAVLKQGAAALPGSDSLDWFFHDWVDTDPGLPDLAIANVFSSKTGAGDQWLAAVDVRNSGYAAAWVPVSVHSAAAVQTVYLKVPARGDVSRRFLLNGEPTEVDVNDGSVPEVEAGVHRRMLQ